MPVTACIARQARFRTAVRLWGGTLLANLVGGWLFTRLVMTAFPEVAPTAIESGEALRRPRRSDLQSFRLAFLGRAHPSP